MSALKQPSAKEICQLFIDYLSSLAHELREDKIDLFRELFFPCKNRDSRYSYFGENIKSVLDDLSREIWTEDNSGSKTLNQQLTPKEAETLYKKFVKIIAEKAASYPVETIIPLWNISREDSGFIDNFKENEYELNIFTRYCEHIKLNNTAEALLIGEYWYLRFHEGSYGMAITSFSDKLPDFAEKQKPFNEKIFSRFIEDEDFVFRFLSVPKRYQNYGGDTGFYWLAYYLAYWILKTDADPNGSSICNRATEEMMHNRTITFPESIVELIRSKRNLIFECAGKRMYDAASFMLVAYTAVSPEEKNPAIFEQIHDREISFKLHLVQYKYMHTDFIPDEFIEYLFTLKEKSCSECINDASYPLEMIRYACDEGVISKKAVIKKLPEFVISRFDCLRRVHTQEPAVRGSLWGVIKGVDPETDTLPKQPYPIRSAAGLVDNSIINRLSLMHKIYSGLEYFFKSKKQENIEEQITFFTIFFERAVKDSENQPVELYTFLELWASFTNEAELLFTKYPEYLKTIITLCSKELHYLKNVQIEQIDSYLYLPVHFLCKKVSCWKGIKPLFIAFRASKKILLKNNLSCQSSLPYEIIRCFHRDKENLKQLRQDMANDFINYLKKTKQPRQPENYTQIEQKEAGFDVDYVEPSPIWRYAYVRALADLGVHSDGRGHFFHEVLAKTAENDPAEDVRKAAERARKELNNLRNGIAGNDNKKRLYEAFWWLRQAHMLSLGANVDAQASFKTRIQEWR